MSACDLLRENPSPAEDEIREGIEGNLCRCTGYQNIVRAVQAAATAMSEASSAQPPSTHASEPGSESTQPAAPAVGAAS